MRSLKIRDYIDEKFAALVEPSVKALAASLEATKRRAFVTKASGIQYTEPEPDHRVRVTTANKVLEHFERSSNRQHPGSDADQVVHQQQDDQNLAERHEQVAKMAATDRGLVREAIGIDELLAAIDREPSEHKE